MVTCAPGTPATESTKVQSVPENSIPEEDEVNRLGGGSGQIVFSSYRDGESQIFLIDSVSRDMIRLTNSTHRLNQPSWSPDGRYLVFVKREWMDNLELYIMNADGSNQIRLTYNFNSFDIEPEWSPDGSRIVFASSQNGNLDIYVFDLSSGEQIQLTDNTFMDTSPSWSPDGDQIVFRSDSDGDNEIFRMMLNTGTQINLSRNPGSDTDPAWSPDGDKIAFVSDRDGDEDIYLMDIDGSNVQQLTDSPGKDTYPAWSPDGSRIAYYSERSGNFELYIMRVDGSEDLQITDHGDFDGFPAWQPIVRSDLMIQIPLGPEADPDKNAWFESQAVQFSSPRLFESHEYHSGFEDLVDNARVVALGGAAEGAHELISLKRHLVELLVTEFGYEKVILIAPLQAIQPINEYILTGNGDLEEILIQTGITSLKIHEVLDLFEWMRSHNQETTVENQVEIIGFIEITPEYPISSVIDFLSIVDPNRIDDVKDMLSCFTSHSPNWFMYMEVAHEQKNDCANSVRDIYGLLIENQSAYEALSSQEAFSFALLSAQFIADLEEYYRVEDSAKWLYSPRNNAEGLKWLLERDGEHSKSILWGSNITISKSRVENDRDIPGLGVHLDRLFPEAYVSIGLTFYSGEINAVSVYGFGSTTIAMSVPDPPPNTFEWIAHQLEWPAFFLDFRGADTTIAGADWLEEAVYTRVVVAAYNPGDPENYYYKLHLPTAFDMLFYIDQVSPTQLLTTTN